MTLTNNRSVLKKTFVFSVLILGLLVSVSSSYGATEVGSVQEKVWSGYWWPLRKGEMKEPLKKYDKLAGAKAEEWEAKNNPSGSGIPSWYGYCHAWSAASILEAEPKTARKTGGTALTIGDQKGLLTAAHAGDIANFYGRRYTGSGSDLNDIRPDELWKVLRRYIKEEKLPLVLDIAPKEEVWNYPVFAYRVTYNPVSAGSKTHNGILEVWLADDAVPRDYVGLKKAYKKYTFRVDLADGMIIEGTGEWTGASLNDHPDFAWFPYIIKPENPELSYNKVCEILGREPAVPASVEVEEEAESETAEEAEAEGESETAEEAEAEGESETAEEAEAETERTVSEESQSEAEGGPEAAAETESEDTRIKISALSLIQIAEEMKSAWVLYVFPDLYDGGTYESGQSFTLKGKSTGTGYLYLFEVTGEDEYKLIYPADDTADNQVDADQRFEFPKKGEPSINVRDEAGSVEYKAVITGKKLKICDVKEQDNGLEELSEISIFTKGGLLLKEDLPPAPVKTADVDDSQVSSTKGVKLDLTEKKTLGGTARGRFTIHVTEPKPLGKKK